MAIQTNRIEIDGSLNVDGSIYQFNQLFEPGGGGTGDVAWASGNVGSDNQLITSAGDGSIVAESTLTYDGNTFYIGSDVSANGMISLGDSSLHIVTTSGDYKFQVFATSGDKLGLSDVGDTVSSIPLRNFQVTGGVPSGGDTSVGYHSTIALHTPNPSAVGNGYGGLSYVTTNESVAYEGKFLLWARTDINEYKSVMDLTNEGNLSVLGTVNAPGLTAGTESNIVYYDTASGELKYGAASSGGGGDVAWASGNVGSNNYMITAAGDGSIVAEAYLTFVGNVLEFDSAANKTIRLKTQPSADATPQSLSILGGDGNGSYPISYYYTFTTYPYTTGTIVQGYKGYDGGDVNIKAGNGADVAQPGSDWGGSGGDLLLSAGDAGSGTGGPYGNQYVSNGVEGTVSISGSVITVDTANFDLGSGTGTDTVDFRHAGDTDTKIQFSNDTIRLFAGAGSFDYEKLTVNSTGVVINEDSRDYDFRVESDNLTDILEVDAGDNQLKSEGNVVQSCVDSQAYQSPGGSTSEFTILSGSQISNADYERNLDKKIFRAKFRYRRSAAGSYGLTVRVKLGSTTIDSYTWTVGSSEQGEVEILFGAYSSTTSMVSWKRLAESGTVDFDYATSGHGSGSGITITIQSSNSSQTTYIYGATLEQLDSV